MIEQLDLRGGGVHRDHRGVVVDLPDGAAGHILVRDYETRGLLRLNLVGAHRYAADPGTDVLCCAYAVDDDPVQLWTPGDPIPSAAIEAARNPSWIVAAHNDSFETAIEQHILAPRYDWPIVPIERHRCTMAAALACGLLPRLAPAEQVVWELSSRINSRGFHVDRQLAEAARRIVQAAAPEIDAELAEITAGAVTTINQAAKLLQWLQQRDCKLESLDRSTIKRLLDCGDDDLPLQVRRVLELRLRGAQAAAKKITALLAVADDDDRIRGAFRYHGTATGRWTGTNFQPQNLKRASIDDAAIAAVATGDYQHVRSLYPQPLAIVGDCSRSMITAAPGHVLIGADFSSIESRVLAWVAGEAWKLDVYRRFDATRDPRDEPYCITACKIFRVSDGSYTKDSPERSVGKTCDLAFGYMGGLGAWRKFEPDRFSDDEVRQFNREWRDTHPKIKAFWYDIDRAALTAVRERGCVVRCGPIAFKSSGAFLLLKLPSGRKLSYPQPRAVGDDQRQHVVFADNAGGQFQDCRHGHGAYGGLWTENVVSGIARDILAEAMLRIEAAGYPIILHVHDEIVCEVPEGFGSANEFTHLMTRKPAWALELPIAASAWNGSRYTKG